MTVQPSWQTVARDYVRVLWRPSEVFRRHADTGIARPFVVAAAAVAIITAAGVPVLAGHERFPLLIGDSLPGPLLIVALAVITSAAIAGVVLLVDGTIVWLGARILRAPVRWRQGAVIALFSSAVFVLTLVVTALMAALSGADATLFSLSLGDVLPDGTNTTVRAVATALGVVPIWSSILFALAVRTLGNPRGSLFSAVAIYWAFHLVLSLAFSAVPFPEPPETAQAPPAAQPPGAR